MAHKPINSKQNARDILESMKVGDKLYVDLGQYKNGIVITKEMFLAFSEVPCYFVNQFGGQMGHKDLTRTAELLFTHRTRYNKSLEV